MTSCEPWHVSISVLAGLLFFASIGAAAFRWNSATPRFILLGAAVVTAVSLYRALQPVKYGSREMWYGSGFNAVVSVRLLALIAEITIAAVLYKSYEHNQAPMMGFAVAFVALIVAAQVPASLGASSSSNCLFAIEESIWMLAAGLLMVPTVLMFREQKSSYSIVMMVTLSIYLLFQCVSVPLYWIDCFKKCKISTLPWTAICNVKRKCEDYGAQFLVWATGYFVLLGVLMLYLQLQQPQRLRMAS